jgi:hypothetical protein
MSEVLPAALRFARMVPADQAREIARTRKVIGELLLLPRTEFPAVPVLLNGEEMTEIVVTDAFTMARPELRLLRGHASPEQAIQTFSRHLPAMLAREQERISRREPPRYRAEGTDCRRHDAQHAGMPRGGLTAPLVLDSERGAA